MDGPHGIAHLPGEVIAQIKSSVYITTLNEVVIELLKNSLDAGASKIDVSLEYSRGNCSVEDDGVGIEPREFSHGGRLAKSYHTSKYHTSGEHFGSNGVFLAALSALSILTIVSHHARHRTVNAVTLSRGEVITRQTPALSHRLSSKLMHGTQVLVRNLFGDMPVRVKQRALQDASSPGCPRDWEELSRSVTSLLLAWKKPTTVMVRNNDIPAGGKYSILRLSTRSSNEVNDADFVRHITRTLFQSTLIPTDGTTSWVSVRGSSSFMTVRGAVSLDPAPTKAVQFLSFGTVPLSIAEGRNVLYEEINKLFLNSSFGRVDDAPIMDEAEKRRRAQDRRFKSDGYTEKERKGGRKGVDRWPMFYLRLEFVDKTQCSHAEGAVEDEKTLSISLKLVRAAILEFLKSQKFLSTQVNELERRNRTPNEATAVSTRSSSALSVASAKSNSEQPEAANGRTPSPFQFWPRVKAGRTPGLRSGGKDASRQSKPWPSLSQYTGSDFIEGPSSMALPKTIGMTSKSGSFLDRPFLDVPQRLRLDGATQPMPASGEVLCIPLCSRERVDIPSSTCQSQATVGDDYIPWHNPATKETVMINSRTGVLRPNASLASSDENMLHAWGQRRIAKRLRISRPDEAIRSPSPWLNKILESWDNEVFLPAETAIPQVAPDVGDATSSSVLHGYRHHCTQLDIDRAFKDCGAGIASGTISKKGLREAKVLSQVEKQFILVEVDETLILIDQHAADERVRIEQLLSDLVRPCNLSKDDIQRLTAGAHVRSGIETCALDGGLRFEVDRKEAALFTQHIQHFADWGILYYIRRGKATLGVDKDTLVLTALPPGIIARCTLEPKLAIEMLRREVWEFQEKGRAATPTVSTEACEEQTHRRHTWVNRIQGCPQGILALLNSRSCRSAIMFNDELSVPECEELISRLSGCAFPFQCAHGRPDLAPLVELGSLTPWAGDVEYIGLGETLSRWTKEQITPRSC